MTLSVEMAMATVLNCVVATGTECRLLSEAYTRVLAEDLKVPHDSPPFDKSLMDGFAVCVPDELLNAEIPDGRMVSFAVGETITAGHIPSVPLRPLMAARIMTGAMLPAECHCVVPIEQVVSGDHTNSVSVPASLLKPGANVMRQGSAAVTGSVLLSAGTRLQPQHVAAMAEFGHAEILVARRPSVAILATGDELVEVSQLLRPGQIRNSNEPMLVSQILSSDAIPVGLGIARDEESELSRGIEAGLQHDLLLLTGGVSAGILDLVPALLERAGVQRVFHGVHMKPGKPLWFGFRDSQRLPADTANDANPGTSGNGRCLVFGLPGNPVSSLACFELFVRPAIRTMMGLNAELPLTACLQEDSRASGHRPVYHPARLVLDQGRLFATVVPWSGSSDLRATVEANGMILLNPESGTYAAGTMVDAWLWGDQRL